MQKHPLLLVINLVTPNIIHSIETIRQIPSFASLGLLVLTKQPDKSEALDECSVPFEVVKCQFSSAGEIAEALRPFKERIRGVVCRGDKNIQYFHEVIPHLPPNVLVSSPASLETATDKRAMREAFMAHAPEITPKFLQVHDASDSTIQQVETTMHYPVIVKPANLASSMLIQACDTREALVSTLGRVFGMIGRIYRRQDRMSDPSVIVEEFMDGEFYSVDSYVMQPGEFYHCPVVGYVPAKKMGIDDFFLYKRFLPSKLSLQEIDAANRTVERALTAIGLKHSAAHVEMVRTATGWKIIEIGPRLGRFRHTMYREAYGIDHSTNDLLIHLDQKPTIPLHFQKFCTAYSIYPHKEGILQTITGLEEIQNNPATVSLRVFKEKGDVCTHAKNGGGALAEFVIADSSKASFDSLTQFVEQNVKAIVI